jgi:hypothetical protein
LADVSNGLSLTPPQETKKIPGRCLQLTLGLHKYHKKISKKTIDNDVITNWRRKINYFL